MRALLIAILVLAFGADNADARKKPKKLYAIERAAGFPPAFGAVPEFYKDPREDRRGDRRVSRRAPPTMASLIPPDWQLEALNPNWNGRRFLSPDGTSWLAVYKAPAESVPAADHMRDVVFGKDETITYLRGERTWVAVSGFKDSRIFYRKAILACAGKAWHHIAFEYPVESKERMDLLVAAIAQTLDNTQNDCQETVGAAPNAIR